MEIDPKLLLGPSDTEEYHSMTAEWDAYFSSLREEVRDNAWRNAVMEVLAELNIFELEHKSDPRRAVRAVVDEGGRRVSRRRSTDRG
jgi:hypothetical protein